MNWVLLLNLFLILQCVYSHHNIGDDCTIHERYPGRCVILAECPSALHDLDNGHYPQQCGFLDIEPIVCCPKSFALTASIGHEKCTNYARIVPYTHPLSITIGTNVPASDFPIMASLGFAIGVKKLWRCGGSLISDQFVITAAHCLHSHHFGNISWVRLGEQNSPVRSNTEFPYDFKIIEQIAHPTYRQPSSYNDIALVKLERAVLFTMFVRPACLYTNAELEPNAKMIATGWGLTKFAGNPSKRLQKVDLDLFTEQECTETYGNMVGSRRLAFGILSASQLCAGGRILGKDTCQGDSGGPLQIYFADEAIHSIVGITSFGKSCGLVNVPAVYTRVSYYISWIESVVWPNAKLIKH